MILTYAKNDSLVYVSSQNCHCVKSVQIRSFFWSIYSCVQSEYRKIRTRKNSAFGHFSRTCQISKMELFVKITNDFQSLTVFTKSLKKFWLCPCSLSLHKTCKNTSFHWLAFSRILAYFMQCNIIKLKTDLKQFLHDLFMIVLKLSTPFQKKCYFYKRIITDFESVEDWPVIFIFKFIYFLLWYCQIWSVKGEPRKL